MGISFSVHDLDGVQTKLDELGAKMAAAIPEAVANSVHLVQRTAMDKLRQQSHAKGTPTPSSPGEPPALISGRLAGSISVQGPLPTGSATFVAKVGPTVVYARIQELGGMAGRHRSAQIPARPYMNPALIESFDGIAAIFREFLSV